MNALDVQAKGSLIRFNYRAMKLNEEIIIIIITCALFPVVLAFQTRLREMPLPLTAERIARLYNSFGDK